MQPAVTEKQIRAAPVATAHQAHAFLTDSGPDLAAVDAQSPAK